MICFFSYVRKPPNDAGDMFLVVVRLVFRISDLFLADFFLRFWVMFGFCLEVGMMSTAGVRKSSIPMPTLSFKTTWATWDRFRNIPGTSCQVQQFWSWSCYHPQLKHLMGTFSEPKNVDSGDAGEQQPAAFPVGFWDEVQLSGLWCWRQYGGFQKLEVPFNHPFSRWMFHSRLANQLLNQPFWDPPFSETPLWRQGTLHCNHVTIVIQRAWWVSTKAANGRVHGAYPVSQVPCDGRRRETFGCFWKSNIPRNVFILMVKLLNIDEYCRIIDWTWGSPFADP